jgi:hypothetical protein
LKQKSHDGKPFGWFSLHGFIEYITPRVETFCARPWDSLKNNVAFSGVEPPAWQDARKEIVSLRQDKKSHDTKPS